MKTHILHRNHIITPQEKRLPVDHPELGEVGKVHSAVLETLGQRVLEISQRNRALPSMEDALHEGRLLAVMPENGLHNADEFIRELAARTERSRRTLKDGAATHPMGRFHPSAVIGGLVSDYPEINIGLAAAFEGPCAQLRPELMARGLTTYPYGASRAVLVVVRPFYPCDKAYLEGEGETKAYNKFY